MSMAGNFPCVSHCLQCYLNNQLQTRSPWSPWWEDCIVEVPETTFIVESHILSWAVGVFLPMKTLQKEMCPMKATGSSFAAFNQNWPHRNAPPHWLLFIRNTGNGGDWWRKQQSKRRLHPRLWETNRWQAKKAKKVTKRVHGFWRVSCQSPGEWII